MMSHKIFFSYSRLDSAFALKLAQDLRKAGADLWIDQLDIQAGTHWDAAVEKALNASICVLVILSPSSIASANVMDEVSYALETGKKIIPVLLQDCPPPLRLRRLHRIDFTKDYDSGLVQLIQNLAFSIPSHKKPKEKDKPVSPPPSQAKSDTAVSVAAEKEEVKLWEEACRLHTMESYEHYLNHSISGAHHDEARLMLKQLELEEKEDELETLLWQKAQSEHSSSLYHHYLEEYPDGDYKTLALAAIADLAKQDKKDQRDRKELAFETKLNGEDFPRPKSNAVLVRKRIIFGVIGAAMLSIFALLFATSKPTDKDLLAWQSAAAKKDSTSIASYILAFPKGKYLTQASAKLDSIRQYQKRLQDSITAASLVPVTLPDTTRKTETSATNSPSKPISAPKPKPVTPAKPVSKYVIGQKLFGGIVASINPTGIHGLIIAEKDMQGVDWETAKKKCELSKMNGYSDWRLPTKEELNRIYQTRDKTGEFAKGMYWSSSEAGNNAIWTLNLANGQVGKFNKIMSWYARPVRSF